MFLTLVKYIISLAFTRKYCGSVFMRTVFKEKSERT